MKISDLLGDSVDTITDPLAPDPSSLVTPAPPTAARAQLSALAAGLPAPTDGAPEVSHDIPPDPTSAVPEDGGIKDLEALMGTTGDIANANTTAESDAVGSELPTVAEPAMDDLLPALRAGKGSRASSRSGSQRRGR